MSIKEEMQRIDVQIDLAKKDIESKYAETKERHASEKGLADEQVAIDVAKSKAKIDKYNSNQ